MAGAGAGAGLGAWFGHLAHGTSRGDAKDIGAMLEPGKAALIVIGVDKDAERIERAATRAQRHAFKREVGDWDEAEQDALAAIARAEATPAGLTAAHPGLPLASPRAVGSFQHRGAAIGLWPVHSKRSFTQGAFSAPPGDATLRSSDSAVSLRGSPTALRTE